MTRLHTTLLALGLGKKPEPAPTEVQIRYILPDGDFSPENPFGYAGSDADFAYVNDLRVNSLDLLGPEIQKWDALHQATGQALSISPRDFMLAIAQLRDLGANCGLDSVPTQIPEADYNTWVNFINLLLRSSN